MFGYARGLSLFVDGGRDFEVRGAVFLDQIMWEGRIEEAIDVEVVLDEEVVALVVLSSGSVSMYPSFSILTPSRRCSWALDREAPPSLLTEASSTSSTLSRT